ncbi:MAG: oligosaccharide flippase family protein [Actinobacteria bacterium]|nr:oligosaccharide flippase family protein [Actinomycetota bacterium]
MQSQPRSYLRGLRHDHLLQNSFFILLSTATMGLLGFLFWLVAARLFPLEQIGVATTLIAATNLLSQVGLLGFNTTLITSLPSASARSDEIDSAVLLVFAATVAAALAYILIVPTFTPKLAFVGDSAPLVAGFALLTAFSAVNLLTDSVFIAYRAARFNFVVDGVIQGGAKLALVAAVVGLGSYGLFLASGLAALAAVVASITLLVLRFDYRPRLRIRMGVVRSAFRASAANYVANLFNLLPIMALPLIVLNRRGPADAGLFFVAFQIANLLYAITYAVSQSLLAEGSHPGGSIGVLARRSAKIQAGVIVPAALALALVAVPLLGIFGPVYRLHAVGTLVLLAAAAPAVALNTWTTALLRLTGSLGALVWSNVIFAATICLGATAWASRGLSDVALAWLLGNLMSGIAGGVWLLTVRTRCLRPDRPQAGTGSTELAGVEAVGQ